MFAFLALRDTQIPDLSINRILGVMMHRGYHSVEALGKCDYRIERRSVQ